MTKAQLFFVGLGRIFLSLIFILSAIYKIMDWTSVETKVVSLFTDWQGYMHNIGWATASLQFLITWVSVVLGIATFLELVGGVLVFFGYKVKLGSFFLIIFVLGTTLFYHCFWFMDDQKREFEMGAFLKNFAILGGLLVLFILDSIKSKMVRFEKGGFPSSSFGD